MTGAKRRVLTTDDLMHKQEGSDRKRKRLTSVVRRRHTTSMEGGDETSEKESIGSSSELEGIGGEVEEGYGDGQSEQDDDDAESEGEEQSTSQLPERFNFSRMHRGQTSKSILSKPSSPDTFMSLGVSAPLQAALSSMSIRTPTGVQTACIPPLLAGELSRNIGHHILR